MRTAIIRPTAAAIYRDARGVRCSAGTFATRREADRAWAADALLGHGRDPRRGKITFTAYVTGVWLPNHELEHTTRQRYSYQIGKHLLPEFGTMRTSDIAPVLVREWDRPPQAAGRVRLDHRRSEDGPVRDLHHRSQRPGRRHPPVSWGQGPTVARKPRTIVTSEQFDLIHRALPDGRRRILVELDVGSGLRWVELTALRVRDLPATRMLTVARAVVEINARLRDTDAPRLLVKDCPKDKEYRRVKLSPEITNTLRNTS